MVLVSTHGLIVNFIKVTGKIIKSNEIKFPIEMGRGNMSGRMGKFMRETLLMIKNMELVH